MRKILDEISILPGVAGSCIFSKEDGPLCADHQLSIDKESIRTMGIHLVRLLQMSKMVDFNVRSAKFKFDEYTVVGMSLESDSVLMTICEPQANCSLVATSAGMLVDDIRKDLAQGITLNVDDVKEILEVDDQQQQQEEGVTLDRKASDVLEKMKLELSGIIGPVAGMVMTEHVEDLTVNGGGAISSLPELVDRMASEIEDSAIADEFKSKCYGLSERAGLLNQNLSPQAQSPETEDVSPTDSPKFDEKTEKILQRIETQLARAIGPMAGLLIQDQTDRLFVNGAVSNSQLQHLVNTLAVEIRDPMDAAAFKTQFHDLSDQQEQDQPKVKTQHFSAINKENPGPSSRQQEISSPPKLKSTSPPNMEYNKTSGPANKSGKVARAMARNDAGNSRNSIYNTPKVDTRTLQQIELGLAQVMGPFAGMIMEENLSKWKKNGPPEASRLPELINTIRQDINDPAQALAFNARISSVLENIKYTSE